MVERPGRSGAKPQKITECLVGDETATVVFSARNEEQGERAAAPPPPPPPPSHSLSFFCAAELLKPGAYVTLRNAKVDMVRSNMRLAVAAAGKIEAADGAAFEPKVRLLRYHLLSFPIDSCMWYPLTFFPLIFLFLYLLQADFNMSAVEFELVPVPDAGKAASGAAAAKEEVSAAAAEGEEAS